MKSSAIMLTILTCFAIPGTSALAADLQEKFDSIYGDKAKHLAPRDSAAFAEKLLSDADELEDDPAMSAFLVGKAMEFWQKGPNNAEKAKVGELLVTNLLSAGDGQFGAKKYAEAAKIYQQASTVARFIKSKRVDELSTRKQIAQLRDDAAKKAQTLKAAVASNPKDTVSARALVLWLVVEMDDPKSAGEHLSVLKDETLREMVPLAARDPDSVGPTQSKDLAEWYKTLAGASGTTLSGKAFAYARVKTYYEQFVSAHKKQDVELLAAEKAIQEVTAEFKKMNLPESAQSQESLGTWQVEKDDEPDHTIFLEFHKGGKADVTTFYPEAERAKAPALPFGLISQCTWKVDAKDVAMGNGWTLPMPLGTKFTIQGRSGKTSDATLKKVSRNTPATTMRKLAGADDAKSTKIRGAWECASCKWDFCDDGTVFQTAVNSSGTTINVYKWKIERNQLTFSGALDKYTFPYPLTKGENRGKQVREWGGRPTEASVIMKPWARAKE